MTKHTPTKVPPQHQDTQPGQTAAMHPKPRDTMEAYRPASKLAGKVGIVTGGDSGIGRAIAIAYAKEGADVCIVFLNETDDAHETQRLIESEGRRCLLLAGDLGDRVFCEQVVEQTVQILGKLDILVNNAGEQHPQDDPENISEEQLTRTFRTNIFSMFFLVQAALPHLKEDAAIINTASITAYVGHKELLDYSATKGAIVSFSRSLAQTLAERKIRVNIVAPGPIWTPLIPSTFTAEHVARFGQDTPLGRPGQPDEVAPAYVFLAAGQDSSYITGQTIHVNGGRIVNG
jgi:NAD(P)-dependent dehydrogenase (short-subunit alcohol dehydrogenase family)